MPLSLAKLDRLSVAEARARLEEKLRTAREKFTRRKSKAALDPSPFLRRLGKLLKGGSVDQLNRLRCEHRAAYDRICARIRARVHQIETNTLPLLFQPTDLTVPIDWHRDPRERNFRWPQHVFHADIRYNDPRLPDFKYVWELNRHQFFADLAADWLVHANEDSAGRLRQYIVSWIEQNEPYYGINWTSALEVAVRSLSWVWSLALTRTWSGWRREELVMAASALVDHAHYLANHLSLYSSPYNHLIGEVTALYVLGQVLREHPESKRWRRVSRRVLRCHGPKQYEPDGFTVEQATGYHFFTTGFLALALHAARQFGDGELEGALLPVVRRAFRAGAAFAGPDGRWPAIGDVDLARSLPVVDPEPEAFWDFRSLCNFGAALVEDEGPLFPEAAGSEEAFWLLGVEALRWLERGAASVSVDWASDPLRPIRLCTPYAVSGGHSGVSPATRKIWSRIGYAHYRGRFLLDCAPIAGGLFYDDTPSTAHGHLDLLQALIWLHGEPAVVDAGMSSYRPGDALFGYQRGVSGHNTVEVVGCPAAEYAGDLDWRRVIRPEQLSLEYFFSERLGVATGSVRYPGVGRLRRTVVSFREGEVWVVDEFVGAVPGAELRWYWLPAEPVRGWLTDLDAVLSPNRDPVSSRRLDRGPEGTPSDDEPAVHPSILRAAWGDGTCLTIWAAGLADVRVMLSGQHDVSEAGGLDVGGEGPFGWRSLGYGHRSPGSHIAIRARAVRARSVLVSLFSQAAPRAALRVDAYEFNLGLRAPAIHRFGYHSPGEDMTWFVSEDPDRVESYALGNIGVCTGRVVRQRGSGSLGVVKWSVERIASRTS